MSETSPPPGADAARDHVRSLLWDAAEIEQQLMIQYLFAAFTLKKHPDATCTPAQLEYVRRWGSQVLMVARQEMEHLALANGILTAIAQDPFFARENLPLQPRYFLGEERARDHSPEALLAGKKKPSHVPCDIPFVFQRFDPETVRRFVCAESPDYEALKKEKGVPVAEWCFGTRGHPCATSLADWTGGGRLKAAAAGGGLRLGRTHVPSPPLRAAGGVGGGGEPFHPGSIQALYDRIKRGLRPAMFTGNPDQQVFVVVEYQINVTPVTDLTSANLAIDLIVEEGEGIDAPPGFQSHYTRFFQVHDELQALLAEQGGKRKGFDPALPVVSNPEPGMMHGYTLEVFHLFNEAYATLLFVLTSLYRNFSSAESSYPFLGTALQYVAFGPFMTMILRPIAEVLVHLKLDPGARETAGPNFHLSPEDELIIWPRPPAPPPPRSHATPDERRALSARLDDIDFLLTRLDALVDALGRLSGDRALKRHLVDAQHEGWAKRQLAFVAESARALANNVRRVYQVGEIQPFVVGP
jgi:ferritin-like protein